MVTAILLAALSTGVPAMGAPIQAVDTVFSVNGGERLEVNNLRGDVVVRAWDRDAVEVRADLSGRQTVEVVRTGTTVRVRPRSERGPQAADFEIRVPRWMGVRIDGTQTDVSVRGTDAEVSVETVNGDVVVEGGRGLLSLRSIQGAVRLRDARGRVDVVSVNDDVTLERVTGDIHVETTNGDVVLERIRSSAVRASTVNGEIRYDGTIADGGSYTFTTHNGDVSLLVSEDVSATMAVSTYHGSFHSEIPIRLTGTTLSKQFSFTLGSGGARVEMESFNGEILLRRR